MSETEILLLSRLKSNLGILTNALEETGLTKQDFDKFMLNPVFSKEVELINEYCLDFAESKLLKLIDNENITAISFYLKEKGAKRGYGNKQPENKQEQSEEENLFGNFE